MTKLLPEKTSLTPEEEQKEIKKKLFQLGIPPPSGFSFGSKKLIAFLGVGLLLFSLPVAVYLVRQRQEIRKKASCQPNPNKCWAINSQNTKEGCEAWCRQREEYEDVCHPYTVLNDECEKVSCWYCQLKPEFRPTLPPTGCQSPLISQRSKEACEKACSCQGWDVDNCFYDTCKQGSDQCWYCEKRESCLKDCCPGCELSCQNLKIYDQKWKKIADLSSIPLGETVRFLVEGSCNEPQGITDARFRINQGGWQKPTGKHKGKFYLEYTFTQPGEYQVEAMVYNPVLGWR